MPSNVCVSLPSHAAEALRDLARREFRHPRDQAQKLLVEGLYRAGALPADQDNADRPVSDKAAAVAATA